MSKEKIFLYSGYESDSLVIAYFWYLTFHHFITSTNKKQKNTNKNAFNQFKGEIIAIYECSAIYMEERRENTPAWIKQIMSSNRK